MLLLYPRSLPSRIVSLLSIAAVLWLPFFVPHQTASAADARDCDNNAVIYCGVSDATELKAKYRENQAGNTEAIYREFGITSEQSLDGMVMGRTTRDNRVYVGDRLVATDAYTAGRQNMPGSTEIAGGAAYKRQPSVSFAAGTQQLDTLVKLDANGRFQYGVILSCGNPVQGTAATPPPAPAPSTTRASQSAANPNFTVEKYVRRSNDSTWRESIDAQPGEVVDFRIVITNTGDSTLSDVNVVDVLPAGFVFDSTSWRPPVSSRGDMLKAQGLDIGSLARNANRQITYSARLVNNAEACQSPYRNTVTVKVASLPSKSDQAAVKVCPILTAASTTKTQTPAPVAATAAKGNLPVTGISNSTFDLILLFIVVTAGGSASYFFMSKYREEVHMRQTEARGPAERITGGWQQL